MTMQTMSPPPAPGDDMIVLGRIVEPYSLHGWVKVHFFGDDPQALGEMPNWWLSPTADEALPTPPKNHTGNTAIATAAAPANWQSYPLESLKPHGKGMIAKFATIDSRTAAEAIDGWYIAAPRSVLPATNKDEYYWADLIGATVTNNQGILLGKVTHLMSSGAHEVLCLRDQQGQERLLPFVAEVVRQVDTTRQTILVEWGIDW